MKNKLSLIYDKRQKDYVVKYPRRCDGALVMCHLINNILEWRIPSEKNQPPYNFEATNFIQELERRGYDSKTLKFSIELKK